ncbi:hypothetical protein HanXRQr2_Chr02g0077711 [Helianthus annuus]|uniref:Uncharacterized protein n=1 Tax=Helianthus annuus TaxID=4232 RepID=A0A9K3JPN6_HELAN|nr:hypothetical protein HanXRQr2_Chr02g0077711 [Helianthus annuus]KAJ0952711.1 hypothetical protein HanPSC8_Chr02g0075491 [Helianthus annuus]
MVAVVVRTHRYLIVSPYTSKAFEYALQIGCTLPNQTYHESIMTIVNGCMTCTFEWPCSMPHF